MKIGIGYDVHKLVSGRDLIIGGVNIPYEKGLLGHSDADVLTHAIMDALLGAAALPDIGRIFPDNDERFRGACSITLLSEVARMVRAEGYEIVNIDSVVMAERPKLAGYIEQMRESLAEVIGVSATQIGVKATTTEGLGFVGGGLGIAAQAVALIRRSNSTPSAVS